MHNSMKIFLVNDDIRAIKAVYEADDNAKQEVFKTFDESIDVGDYLIVESETRHMMTVVKVVEVDVEVDIESPLKIKWVVEAIDTKNYNTLQREERKMISMIDSAQKNKKREELKAALFADQENLKALPIAHMKTTSGDIEVDTTKE